NGDQHELPCRLHMLLKCPGYSLPAHGNSPVGTKIAAAWFCGPQQVWRTNRWAGIAREKNRTGSLGFARFTAMCLTRAEWLALSWQARLRRPSTPCRALIQQRSTTDVAFNVVLNIVGLER